MQPDNDLQWYRIRRDSSRAVRWERLEPGLLPAHMLRPPRARAGWPGLGSALAIAGMLAASAAVCSGCEPADCPPAAGEPVATGSPVDRDPAELCSQPGDVVVRAVGGVWDVHVCFVNVAPSMDLRAEPAQGRLTLRNSVECHADDPAGDVAHNEITIGLDTGPIAAVLYSACTFDPMRDYPPQWGDQ